MNKTAGKSQELLTVKFRYKKPDQEVSKLIVHSLLDGKSEREEASENFKWSAAVAGFGMILRHSEYRSKFSADEVLELATSAKGRDKEGYRQGFINLIKAQKLMNRL